jgi:hypothetical protein
MVKFTAKDEHDKAMDINQRRQTKVIGVSFEGSEPVFLVGNAEHQDKVTMKNIAKIDMIDELKEKPNNDKEVNKK